MTTKEIVEHIRPHVIVGDWVDVRRYPTGVTNCDMCTVLLPFIVAMRLFPALKANYLENLAKTIAHTTAIVDDEIARLGSEENVEKEKMKLVEYSITCIAESIQDHIRDSEPL